MPCGTTKSEHVDKPKQTRGQIINKDMEKLEIDTWTNCSVPCGQFGVSHV